MVLNAAEPISLRSLSPTSTAHVSPGKPTAQHPVVLNCLALACPQSTENIWSGASRGHGQRQATQLWLQPDLSLRATQPSETICFSLPVFAGSEPGSHIVWAGLELTLTEAGLRVLNILLPPPRYRDYRHVPPPVGVILCVVDFGVSPPFLGILMKISRSSDHRILHSCAGQADSKSLLLACGLGWGCWEGRSGNDEEMTQKPTGNFIRDPRKSHHEKRKTSRFWLSKDNNNYQHLQKRL